MAIPESSWSSLKYDILPDCGWVLKKKTLPVCLSEGLFTMLSLILEHTQWRQAQEGDLAWAQDSPGGWDFRVIFILSDLYAVIALGLQMTN